MSLYSSVTKYYSLSLYFVNILELVRSVSRNFALRTMSGLEKTIHLSSARICSELEAEVRWKHWECVIRRAVVDISQ